jgi:hypothetical protein
VLTQPVLAGRYLTGDVDAIVAHSLTGTFIVLGALIIFGVALAYALAGRGTLWALPVSVLLVVAVGAQAAVGFIGLLEWHIPLGVVIVTSSLLLTVWAWSPLAARPRQGKPRQGTSRRTK